MVEESERAANEVSQIVVVYERVLSFPRNGLEDKVLRGRRARIMLLLGNDALVICSPVKRLGDERKTVRCHKGCES